MVEVVVVIVVVVSVFVVVFFVVVAVFVFVVVVVIIFILNYSFLIGNMTQTHMPQPQGCITEHLTRCHRLLFLGALCSYLKHISCR